MYSIGEVRFKGHVLSVYGTPDEPLFMAVEVARVIDYSVGNTEQLLRGLEHDEKILIRVDNTRSSITSINRGNPNKWFITELGLYNVLAQSRKPAARVWRRIVHQELIDIRKGKQFTIFDRFQEWDEDAHEIWFDDETGKLMTARTVQGGDVEIIPYTG